MSESLNSRPGPAVVVVVINFRTPALSIQCVDSVRRSAGVNAHIVVIDNDSGDDSVDQFRAAWAGIPSVAIHPRPVNDGFAGGANAGIALARAHGARWALLLNSDTIVAPDCLRLLLEEGERDDRVALVNPCILFGAPSERLWFGGARFSLWTGRPVHVGLHRPHREGWQTRRDAPFATGCALLVRLGAIAGGPFDAPLFGYAEDLDLSLRLRRDGWRLRYVPEATVWHDEGSSHRRAGGEALRFYLNTRNLLRVVARHARWYHWVTLAPMLVVDVVGRQAAVAIRRRDGAAFWAVWRGAWHAIAGGRHPIERSGR
jgi:GT2 family glycosyltransferase